MRCLFPYGFQLNRSTTLCHLLILPCTHPTQSRPWRWTLARSRATLRSSQTTIMVSSTHSSFGTSVQLPSHLITPRGVVREICTS